MGRYGKSATQSRRCCVLKVPVLLLLMLTMIAGCSDRSSPSSSAASPNCIRYQDAGIDRLVWGPDGGLLVAVTRNPNDFEAIVRVLDARLKELESWPTSVIDATQITVGAQSLVYWIDPTGAVRSRGIGVVEAVRALVPGGNLAFPSWTTRGLIGLRLLPGDRPGAPGEVVLFDMAGDGTVASVYTPSHLVGSLVASETGDVMAVHELDPPEIRPRASLLIVIRKLADPIVLPMEPSVELVSLGSDGSSALAIDSSTGFLLRVNLADGRTEVLRHNTSAAVESTGGVLAWGEGRTGGEGTLCSDD